MGSWECGTPNSELSGRECRIMSYYPIFLELEGKIALVIGGGRVSERKIETLLSYGASIDIVSKNLTDKLKGLVEVG
ncbi:MAG: hypothetical protein JJE15_04355, partial [Desulfobacteraceae bacterium]|nr:hypothetical protein [Desulfobacteraceae bacterium]